MNEQANKQMNEEKNGTEKESNGQNFNNTSTGL